MALANVNDYKAFLNQTLYALGAEAEGYHWDAIVRRGLASQADVNTVKADYATYLPTRTTRGAVPYDSNPLPIKSKVANGT